MLSVKRRKRVKELSDKVQQASSILAGFSKEFVESEHPRAGDGKFTSGSGGSDSKESTDSKDQPQKSSALRKTVAAVIGVYGGIGALNLIAGSLFIGAGIPPVLAGVVGAAGGLYVGRKLYQVLAKAQGKEPLRITTDEEAKQFIDKLISHLSSEEMDKVNAKLQSKLKESK